MAMAITGNNGDNETNIGGSNSVSYSLHDESNNEIEVNRLNKPIEFWIAKDTSMPIEPYQYVDAMNLSQNQNYSLKEPTRLLGGFLVSGFKLNGQNVSISIHIKPNSTQSSIGYLVLLKFGDNPIFNSTNSDYYDLMNIFCPVNDLIQVENDSFYHVFANMSRVNSYKVKMN